jgi:hypothetical protein
MIEEVCYTDVMKKKQLPKWLIARRKALLLKDLSKVKKEKHD